LKNINSENINELPSQFVKIKHIETEENRNIFVENLDNNKIYIYIGNTGWKEMKKKDVVKNVTYRMIDDIDNTCSKVKDCEKAIINNYLEDVERGIQHNIDNEVTKKLSEDIVTTLYEGRHQIVETARKNEELDKN
jgi:carboxypeptidase C (cathepsin A)